VAGVLLLLGLGGLGAVVPAEAVLRDIVAETAVAQVERPDPRWHPEQRDCAGLVRYAFRAAYLTLAPTRVKDGLWRDRTGRPSVFADAETLVQHNFAALGRGPETRQGLKSGDLIAFRQQASTDAPPSYHLMLIVRPVDPAHDDAVVIYHPGTRDQRVRLGSLRSLLREAPREWQPVPENPFFLGFFRFREWMSHD
jgi:hypothetical protein